MTTDQSKPTTTDAGIPVESDEYSLTVGPDGPILLQDHYLIEKMAQFNRERVPERQPHAKGGGAFGCFEVTQRRQPVHQGGRLPAGHAGPRWWPGSRPWPGSGAAPTPAGPARFRAEVLHRGGQLRPGRQQHAGLLHPGPDEVPDFIRSQKRRADNGLRDNDMQWDFWTLSPESAHQVTYLMGDRGIPQSWRHMNGYGSPHLHVDQRRRARSSG